MRTLGASVVLLFGLTALAQAKPLDLNHVPADVQWVAHMDVDAMRASPVIEKAFQAASEEWPDQLEGHMDRLHDEFGLDLQNGLHSITVYGKQLGEPTGVLIANVDVNKELLEWNMKDAPGYSGTTHGKHTLHSWTDHHGPMTGVFYTPTTLVFGRSVADVSAALDVLDGKSASLATKKSSLSAKLPENAMFVGRAVGVAESTIPSDESPLVKQTESIAVAFGINGDEVWLDADLVAKSAETAPLFKHVLDGARDMAILEFGANNPAMSKLLNTFTLNISGKSVNARWRAPADELWTQAEAAYSQYESKQ
jgi:hypothetical protein